MDELSGRRNASVSTSGRRQMHKPSEKRKLDDESKPPRRTAKRKKIKTGREVDNFDLDIDNQVNAAIGKLNGSLLADLVARQTKRFQPKLSLIELEDRRIPEQAFVDTTSWETMRDKDQLPDFIERFAMSKKPFDHLCEASVQNGCPHTLVITSAGLRAADLTRTLRKFQTKSIAITKMFAKHIKLKDAIETMKNTRTNIGVGTPQRINDLINEGALLLDDLKRIVVDASHINLKNRGILDMSETLVPLVDLLTREELKDRYDKASGTVKLLFY